MAPPTELMQPQRAGNFSPSSTLIKVQVERNAEHKKPVKNRREHLDGGAEPSCYLSLEGLGRFAVVHLHFLLDHDGP